MKNLVQEPLKKYQIVWRDNQELDLYESKFFQIEISIQLHNAEWFLKHPASGGWQKFPEDAPILSVAQAKNIALEHCAKRLSYISRLILGTF